MPFLNRIALITEDSPLNVDPFAVLNEILLFAPVKEYEEMFDKFCQSAIDDHCSWNEGGCGNLLFVIGKFELLIEVAYLIYAWHREENEREINLEKLDSFFQIRSLADWKREFHGWVEAAFGSESLTVDQNFRLLFEGFENEVSG
jgi:hypothetical protein